MCRHGRCSSRRPGGHGLSGRGREIGFSSTAVGGEGAQAVRVRQRTHRATPPCPLPRAPLPTRPPSFANVA
ncbi:hypothetical protein SBD_5070 [Streptomyces bottropensis ATCC 25435]|uniref:Uncharacterized protein n=1 Tax=Streptomyces bottropensis ATCC 25435 TaxID=1054862 RepID=M3EBG8_9ACTN|nr:hypothetical protein SBD_5070 [Streptomyces bottropensis ATCC 25435]